MFTFFWSRSASIWAAALYILLGLVLVLFPGMTGTVFCWALAIAAAVYAIGRLVRWFQGRKAGTASAADLLLGIIFLVLCLFCLLRPASVLSFLPLVLGIVLLLDGIGKLPLAIDAGRDKDRLFWPLLISALLPLLLGILIVINPFGAAKAVLMFFGVSLIADGVCDLVAAISARR